MAWVEIIVSIVLFIYSTILFFEVEILSVDDQHGYGFIFAIYLQAYAGLFGLAGVTIRKLKWYSIIIQLVLLIHTFYFISFFINEI